MVHKRLRASGMDSRLELEGIRLFTLLPRPLGRFAGQVPGCHDNQRGYEEPCHLFRCSVQSVKSNVKTD